MSTDLIKIEALSKGFQGDSYILDPRILYRTHNLLACINIHTLDKVEVFPKDDYPLDQSLNIYDREYVLEPKDFLALWAGLNPLLNQFILKVAIRKSWMNLYAKQGWRHIREDFHIHIVDFNFLNTTQQEELLYIFQTYNGQLTNLLSQ